MTSPGWPPDLPSRIDHTLLRPEASTVDVHRLCAEAQCYKFGAVFVHPCYLAEVARLLAGSGIRVGTPIGFPFGAQTTPVKAYEAEQACRLGAQDLDMVINIGRLKSGDYDLVREDMAAVVKATPQAGHKVILETCYLTEEEKLVACRLALEAGVDYVKTSTGFGPGGATEADVRLMASAVGSQGKVKAAGGIRDLALARALLRAGADRIGTSAGVGIVTEWLAAGSQEAETGITGRAGEGRSETGG